MDPGDALFFHSNLLHRSDQNTSEMPRWSLICCYNTQHNDPYITGGRHPNYSPLEKLPDDRVRQLIMQKRESLQLESTMRGNPGALSHPPTVAGR
jgi:ectoine hydroxylase-related dioxygenase (phytanoyl-CoA dioxygenase family)